MSAEKKEYAFLAFVLLALTDFLDGVVARIFGYVSDFGKIFDPLADKVFILSFLSVFWRKGLLPRNITSTLPILVLLELVLALTGYAAYTGRLSSGSPVKLGANWFGKIKFTLEIVFGMFLFSYASGNGDSFSTVGIAIWSDNMFTYSFYFDALLILRLAIFFAGLSILSHSTPLWLPEHLKK